MDWPGLQSQWGTKQGDPEPLLSSFLHTQGHMFPLSPNPLVRSAGDLLQGERWGGCARVRSHWGSTQGRPRPIHTHTHTHTHTCSLSLTHTHTLTHTHSHTHIPSLSHTLTNTLSHTHTLSLSNLESVRGARRWCPSVAAPDSLEESTAVGLGGWILRGVLSVQTDAFSGYSSFFMYFSVPPGLHCCARTFFSCGNWGLLFVAIHRLLITVASLAVGQGL